MLKHYHIVHYIGHGAYDATKCLGTLAFEKRLPNAEDLSAHQFYRNLSAKVGFVFLNACDSGREVGGIAEELVRRGVPAVLGMRRSVLDTAAIEFARFFYHALAFGWPVDTAVVQGRVAMINAVGGDDSNDQWVRPILYMRSPDGRIFQ
jgi:CHAT domain-containing protein